MENKKVLMLNYEFPPLGGAENDTCYLLKEFSEIIKKEMGLESKIEWDLSKPDGTFEKRTDIQRLKSIYPEFNPRTFKEGLKEILNNPEEIKRILN